MHPLALRASALALLVPAALAQAVHVVDDDGGADFTDIQPAVDAASDGDVVLIREGEYTYLRVEAKGLQLVADAGAVVRVEAPVFSSLPALVVRGIGPNQSFVARGLTLTTDLLTLAPTMLELADNEGPIWIEDCSLEISAGHGLSVVDCAGVTLTRCAVTSSGFTNEESIGASLVDSEVALYDCEVVGGFGQLGTLLAPTPGAAGAVVTGGTLFLSGGSITGGRGGDAFFDVYDGADGGPGLVLDADALVRLRDTELAGGAGGLGTGGSQNGQPGEPLLVLSGSLVELDGTARSSEVSSPVRAGVEDVEMSFAGDPGDLVLQLVAPGPAVPAYAFVLRSALVVDAAFEVSFRGLVEANGTLVVEVPTQPLDPAVEFVEVATQAAHVPLLGGGIRLGSPSAVLLLPDSI